MNVFSPVNKSELPFLRPKVKQFLIPRLFPSIEFDYRQRLLWQRLDFALLQKVRQEITLTAKETEELERKEKVRKGMAGCCICIMRNE